jgi:hypothetical protein
MLVQSHIHLSTTLSGAPEYSPDTKWKVRQDGWLLVPNIVATHRRTLTVKLAKHRLLDGSGDPIQLMDYRYIVKVDDYWDMTADERLDALLAMQGKQVYLVDNRHVADRFNHTSDVRTMYLPDITDIANLNPQLQPLYISIQLVDDTIT